MNSAGAESAPDGLRYLCEVFAMRKYLNHPKSRALGVAAVLTTAAASARADLPSGVESALNGLIGDVAIVGGIAVGIAVSIATFFIVKRVISRM